MGSTSIHRPAPGAFLLLAAAPSGRLLVGRHKAPRLVAGVASAALPRQGGRRGARAADWAGLENRCTGNCTEGSNPSLSAFQFLAGTLLTPEVALAQARLPRPGRG